MNRSYLYFLVFLNLSVFWGIGPSALQAQQPTGMQESFQWPSPPQAWSFGGVPTPATAIFSPQEYPQAYELADILPEQRRGLIIGQSDPSDSVHTVYADLTTTWTDIPISINMSYRVLGPIRENDGVYISLNGGQSFTKVFAFSSQSQDSFRLGMISLMNNQVMQGFRSPQTLIFRFKKEVQGPIMSDAPESREGLWLNYLFMADMNYVLAMSQEQAPLNTLYVSGGNSGGTSADPHSVAGLIQKPLRKYHFLSSPTDPSVLAQLHSQTEPMSPDTFGTQDRPLIMFLPVSGWDVNRENSLARNAVFEEFDSLPRLRVVQGPSLDTLVQAYDTDSLSMMDLALEAAVEKGADYIYHAHIDTITSQAIYDVNGNIGNLDLGLSMWQYLIRVSDGKAYVELVMDATNSNNKIRALNSVVTLAGSAAAVSGNEATAAAGSEILQAQINTGGIATQWGNSDVMPKLEKLMMKVYMDPLAFVATKLLVKGEIQQVTENRKLGAKNYEIEVNLGQTHGLKEQAGLVERATVLAGMWDGYSYLTSEVIFQLAGTEEPLGFGKVIQVDEHTAVVRIPRRKADRLVEALEVQPDNVQIIPSYR